MLSSMQKRKSLQNFLTIKDNAMNILLLEDDTILAQTMVQILEAENYTVTLVDCLISMFHYLTG